MRIAVNTRLLLKGRLEGIGWFAYHTLKRIAASHPQHQFLFLFDRPFDDEFVFGANVTPRVIAPPSRHPVLWYMWFEWSVPRALKQWNADVFLSPDGYGSLRTAVPTCLVVHDLAFEHYPEHLRASHRWYLRHYTRLFCEKASRIVTVSEYSKKDIAERYHIPPEKIAVACNGAHEAYHQLTPDEREAAKEEYAGGAEYFVFVGALHPRKNVEALLRAFIRFKKRQRSNMKLVIVGRMAWKYEALEGMKEKMPFKEDVTWLGYRGAEELARIIGGAYALVYASLFEGFGIPILEALTAGVPAVVSNTSSMPEVAGDAGLLCDPTSKESIAEAMQKIYKDEALRARLVAAAPAQAARFSWERAADVLWESVEQCAESTAQKGR
jgi:glycosyltransferase involved in cell wall biosynthesis